MLVSSIFSIQFNLSCSKMETPKTSQPPSTPRRFSLGSKGRRNIFGPQKSLNAQRSLPDVRKPQPPTSRTRKTKSSTRLFNGSFDEKCVKKLVLSPILGQIDITPPLKVTKKKLVFETPSKMDTEEKEADITWSPTDLAPPPSPKSD